MKFEKVSFKQWKNDVMPFINTDSWEEEQIENFFKQSYNNIKIPTRATEYSAGYDFCYPFPSGILYAGRQLIVPTGIRWVGEDCKDKVLILVPRSGLGFKKGLKLRNTAGIIDADYQYSNNEGHIMAKISVEEDCELQTQKGFIQGIIIPFYTVEDDSTSEKRNGGFGSTDN